MYKRNTAKDRGQDFEEKKICLASYILICTARFHILSEESEDKTHPQETHGGRRIFISSSTLHNLEKRLLERQTRIGEGFCIDASGLRMISLQVSIFLGCIFSYKGWYKDFIMPMLDAKSYD